MRIQKMLEVVGHRVMIRPQHFDEELEWGFKLDVGEDWKRERAATVIGTIVSVGSNAWKDYSDGLPWAKVGDKVYYAKYAGKTVTEGEIDYIIVNDEDVQCIVHDEEEE